MLYEGAFNWEGERFHLWTNAGTPLRAWLNLTSQVHKKLNVPHNAMAPILPLVRRYFNGSKDNYSITVHKKKEK